MKIKKYLKKRINWDIKNSCFNWKYNYFENRVEENKSQEFISKNIDETRNYFLEEIEQNELMSTKHGKVSTTLNYVEYFLILTSKITGCISISTLLLCLVFL